jgi:hypothetical protein
MTESAIGTGVGSGIVLASASAVALVALAACSATKEGRVGISVKRHVPSIGVVEFAAGSGWKFGAEDEELCGCVVFLGPDGHPIEGAAVGQIRNGSGGGPIPKGATGWRAVLTNEDCTRLNCDDDFGADGPEGTALALAASWLTAPTDPQRPYVLLGSRLLDGGARQVHSDMGSWERSSFLEVCATVVGPDRELAWAMLELCLEAGPAAQLTAEQRAALEQRVTIHEALRLNLDGPEFAPFGFHGEIVRTGPTFGARVSVNGSQVYSGSSQAPGAPGELPAAGFYVEHGLVDHDATLSRNFANRMDIRCKRPGEPVTTTNLAMRFEPSDG